MNKFWQGMYHPTRGGVRGGKDQFDWANVKTDKDRECYLGHSLMAPVGRWQEGKDLTWYAKENKNEQAKRKNEEFLNAKKIEENALMSALGFRVVEKPKEIEVKKEKIEPVEREVTKSKGPQMPQMSLVKNQNEDNDKLDNILLKLLKKHKISEIYEALKTSSDSKKSKKHKKEKHKSKKRSSRDRDDKSYRR